MSHVCSLFSGDQVATGSLEELHHRLVFERRRVRDVNDDLDSRHRLRQPLACEGVDPRVRRCRQHLVTTFPKIADQLRTDQAAATNNYDLHVLPPALPCRGTSSVPSTLRSSRGCRTSDSNSGIVTSDISES